MRPAFEVEALSLFRRLSRLKPKQDLDYLRRRCEILTQGIGEYSEWSASRSPGTAMGEALSELRRRQTELQLFSAGMDTEFRLFVMGEGNSGKSATVNALLGASVATEAFEACTWRIDAYAPPGAKSRLIDCSGKEQLGSLQELRLLVEQDEQRRRDSKVKVRALYKEQRGNHPPEAREQLKAKLRREHLYESQWIEAQWRVATHPSLQGIWLVDTPGLNQDDPLGVEGGRRRGAVDQRVKDYYRKADGVLWILDGIVVSSASAKASLESVRQAFADLGGEAENAILVVNRMDLVRDRGGEEAVAMVTERAREHYGDMFRDIVPFSAREAQGESPAAKAMLSSLRGTIDRRFRNHAASTRIRLKQRALLAHEADLGEHLRECRSRFQGACSEFAERDDHIVEAITTAKGATIEELKKWKADRSSRLEENFQKFFGEVFDTTSETERRRIFIEKVLDMSNWKSEYRRLFRSFERQLQRLSDRLATTATFPEYTLLPPEPQLVDITLPELSEMPAFNLFDRSTRRTWGEALDWQTTRKASQLWEKLWGPKKKKHLNEAMFRLEASSTEFSVLVETQLARLERELRANLRTTFSAVYLQPEDLTRATGTLNTLNMSLERPIQRADSAAILLASSGNGHRRTT